MLAPIELIERRVVCRSYPFADWTVAVVRYLPDHEGMLVVLDRAVGLVQETAGVHGAWLRPHVSRFLILDVTYAGHRRATRSCVLPAKLLRKGDVAVVASTLVHEATHGRFAKYRYRANRRERVRMEIRCVAEEAQFLRHPQRLGWANAELWARYFESTIGRTEGGPDGHPSRIDRRPKVDATAPER